MCNNARTFVPWTTRLIRRLWVGLAGPGAGCVAANNAKTGIANAAGDRLTAASAAQARIKDVRAGADVSMGAAILAQRGRDWYPKAERAAALSLGAAIALIAGLVPWAPGLLESLRSAGNPQGKVLLGDVS